VVGDRFTAFHGHRGVVRATDVLHRVRTGDAPPALAVGQGLSDEQLAELPGRPVARAAYPHPPGRALVGPVSEAADGSFHADLLLDDRVRVLDDHLNGQHTPAVTLIEAARQTWILVTERHLLDDERRAGWVVSEIRHIGATFQRYLFPLPATVICRLANRRASAVGELVDFVVTVHQGDVQCARIEAGIHVVPRALAAKQEHLAARQAIRDALIRSEPEPR